MPTEKCVIVDIDGTLANNKRRSPYDMDKIKDDPVIPATKVLVDWAYENCFVFLVSWRPESARKDTEERLAKNSISYTLLFMRPTDDTRPDTEIKKEIYEMHIKDVYSVLFAIDDRTRIVDQRRAMGIYTLDCNQTREEF